MSKLNRDIKIYLELYGPITLDILHKFAEGIGIPTNSSKLEKILNKDKEIVNLGYVQKEELANPELDAVVKFGDNYLVSNWYLHPYYFDKRKKPYTRRAIEVYHAKGLGELLK